VDAVVSDKPRVLAASSHSVFVVMYVSHLPVLTLPASLGTVDFVPGGDGDGGGGEPLPLLG
jgi:hypothetical protein